MKKIIFFIFFLNTCYVFGQSWVPQQIPNANQNDNVTVRAMYFLNADKGWMITGQNNSQEPVKIYKTTDKGNNWSAIYDFNITSELKCGAFDIKFVNENVGYAECGSVHNNQYRSFLYKTTNSGNSWTMVSDLTAYGFYDFPKDGTIKLLNESTLLIFNNLAAAGLIFKTTNSGSNWAIKYNQVAYLHGMESSKIDGNTVYLYGTSVNDRPIIIKSNDFMETFENYSTDPLFIANGAVGALSVITKNNADNLFFSIYNKFYKSENPSNISLVSTSSINSFEKMNFKNENFGILADYNKTYSTTNGGLTFNLESTISDDPNSLIPGNLNVTDQVAYVSSYQYPGKIFVRELGTHFNTYNDNVLSSTSAFTISGRNYTNTYDYVRGGSIDYSSAWTVNPNTSNEKLFLKWGDGNRTIVRSLNYTSSGSFTNYYKTKSLSTDFSAISKPSSTKALKESHGYIDRLHTSLGSIFFSRSTNDGTSFSTEEIVNNTFPLTENNINPYLCEVKTNLVVGMDAEKNSAATWEARDGNNIKIMYAQRQTLNGYGTWDAHLPQYSAKSFNVDATGNSNFQSLPKISAIGGSDNSYFTVTSYLKPVGSTVKLMARICNGIYLRGEYEVSSGNISDFAISSTLGTIGNGTSIHYAYKKDNNIFYKNIQFYVYDPTYGVTVSYPETNISTGDANTSRFSPDISVRRGSTAGSYLPIVTYQGITPLTRVYSIDEVSASPGLTETRTVQFTQYPIMVTYMMSPTTGWSNPTAQPSSGTIVQSDPNIEGSATGNGYILSFRKGNSGYYQYSNIQNYHCEPPSFLGTDAKLVKGSYSTPLGGALLTTLTNENQFYKLGKQNVSITNVNSQVQDGVYGNIKGVVNMNEIDYVFNMGPIFVATGSQVDMPLFGDALNEVTPITGIEFNEYLRSEPFTLNNGDTLILGATANYIAVDKQDFYPMKYTVNLMNANTQEVSRVLFSDTIHIEDEEMTEYYRGFVFSDLNPEDGNVYLQIMVEEVSNTDAKYNYVGIYQGESEVQDRSGRSDPTNGVFVDFGHSRNPSSVLTVKPTTYSLAQNFPNPFNPSTTIQYSVPNDGLVQMRIYDISGREVMNLVNENKVAGNYEVKFNGANLSSGIYFYRINAGEFVQTKRMVLVK